MYATVDLPTNKRLLNEQTSKWQMSLKHVRAEPEIFCHQGRARKFWRTPQKSSSEFGVDVLSGLLFLALGNCNKGLELASSKASDAKPGFLRGINRLPRLHEEGGRNQGWRAGALTSISSLLLILVLLLYQVVLYHLLSLMIYDFLEILYEVILLFQLEYP